MSIKTECHHLINEIERDLFRKTNERWKMLYLLQKNKPNFVFVFFNTSLGSIDMANEQFFDLNKQDRDRHFMVIKSVHLHFMSEYELDTKSSYIRNKYIDRTVKQTTEMIMEDYCIRKLYEYDREYAYLHKYYIEEKLGHQDKILDERIGKYIIKFNGFSEETVLDIVNNNVLQKTDNCIYICMPYFGKYDLEHLLLYYENMEEFKQEFDIDNLILPCQDHIVYFNQIVKQLHALHCMGICHRDLKLSNCVMDPFDNTIRVIDFGHASFYRNIDSARNRQVFGTYYMYSPEIIKEINELGVFGNHGYEYDIWCLGIILYELYFKKALQLDQLDLYNWKKYRIYHWRNELFSELCCEDIEKRKQINLEKYTDYEYIMNKL